METVNTVINFYHGFNVAGGQNAERQWRPNLGYQGMVPELRVAGGQNAERQWRRSVFEENAGDQIRSRGAERRKAMETMSSIS